MKAIDLAVVALAVVFVGCGTPSEAACEGTCVKRAECFGDVDADTCSTACADSQPRGDQACIDADVAFQTCLARQDCSDFATSAGCDGEADAVRAACAP